MTYAINKNILTIVHDCCEYEGGINNAGRCQFVSYSSLSEEESKSIRMKERQKEIIKTTEQILNIIYKYKGDE